MRLTGAAYDELMQALLDAYDASTLARMLRIELDKDLTHYASEKATLPQMVAAVIEAAEREGWTEALVAGAARYNPSNRRLVALAAAWPADAEGTPPQPPRPPRAGGGDVRVGGDVHGPILTGDIRESVINLYGSYAAWPLWIRLALLVVLVAVVLTLLLVLRQALLPAPQSSTDQATVTAAPGAVCAGGVAPSEEALAAMQRISGGTFIMGDNQEERLQHAVTVATFWMDRFEVTNREYQRYLATTGAPAPPGWEDNALPPDQTAFQPVVNVTWREAADYCAALGKRLPTEAEWEYACRGPDGYRYPWGDESTPELANTLENACGRAQMVGSYSPGGDSPFGVADMAGNVMEWVASQRRPYPYADDERNLTSDAGQPRVIRGGAWVGEQWQGSCTVRSGFPPEAALDHVGFRCAADSAP